jgi:hypothetical protein
MPRILIEDNSVNQRVNMGLLNGLGIRANAPGNGEEGIEMLAMAPYELIFMDCQMPEMGGHAGTNCNPPQRHSRAAGGNRGKDGGRRGNAVSPSAWTTISPSRSGLHFFGSALYGGRSLCVHLQ